MIEVEPQRESFSATGSGRAVLLGATSVVGFTLARRFPDQLASVANPHNRAADGEDWHRARLDRVAEWLPWLTREKPNLLIYAHAVCDVAKCERHVEWARRMNIETLASVVDNLPPHTRLVYLSSDHVFGGDGVYREASLPRPISVYGQTRVEAEKIALARPNSLVVRFGLPIGTSLSGRNGFFDWLRYRQQRGLPITVIHDEARSAVWADDVATRVLDLARSDVTGLRHITATRAVGRPELANFLLEYQNLSARFELQGRAEQSYPHIGKIELATDFRDELADSLPSVVDTGRKLESRE